MSEKSDEFTAGNAAIRPQVHELVALGIFPAEDTVLEAEVLRIERLMDGITKPATDAEARLLLPIFGNDDSLFGLKWTLVHFIETAPGWPLEDALNAADPDNEWIRLLKLRIVNALRS